MFLEQSESAKILFTSDSVTPWTVAHQASLSTEFFRQEYWSGLPILSLGDLPDPGIEPGFSMLQACSLPSEPAGNQKWCVNNHSVFYFSVLVSWVLSFWFLYFKRERDKLSPNCERNTGLWFVPHHVPARVSLVSSVKLS